MTDTAPPPELDVDLKVSPSQISNFEDCETKWFRESVLKEPRPDTEATLLGTACHEALEYWLEHGRWNDFLDPKVASIVKVAEASPLYRRIIGKGSIEAPAGFTYRRVHFNGRIDFNWPDEEDKTHGFVLDHKTSSDFKWAKTPSTAYEDIQTIIYAISCMLHHGWESVTVIYGYFSSKRPRPLHPVYAPRHTMATLLPLLDRKFVSLDRMKDLRRINNIAEATKTPSTCFKYGGCPHKVSCFPSALSKVNPFTLDHGDPDMMNFLDQLTANNAPAVAAPAPTQPAPAPAPVAPAFNFAVPQVQQPLASMNPIVPQTPAAPPSPAAPVFNPFAAPAAAPAAPAPAAPVFNPFAAPAAPAFTAPAFAAPAAVFAPAAAPAAVAETVANVFAPPGVTAPTPIPPETLVNPPEKKTRKRRTKAEMEAARAEEARADAAGEPKTQASTEGEDNSDEAPTVYFGCIPLGVETTNFEEFLEDTGLIAQYEAREKIPYIAAPYNEGPRRIIGVLLAKLQAGEVQLPTHMLVASDGVWAPLLRGEIARLGEAVRVVLRAG